MKLKRNTLILLIGLLLTLVTGELQAQQDPMFSQYMFNGLAFNPAYAGSRDALSLTGLYRRMWIGIQGAPETQTFSIHSPSGNRRHGFGLTLSNDQVSYLSQSSVHLDYAFRIPMGGGNLALGLRASGFQYRINWSQADFKDPSDQVSGNYARNMLFPNAGFGVYYSNDKFYAGLSVPRLMLNSLEENQPGLAFSRSDSTIALLQRHYFLSAGYVFDLSDAVKLKPSLLLKYVGAAVPQADLNCNVYFYEKFGLGLSLRSGDGGVFLAEYLISPQLRIGYAYDYPFTRLNQFNSGSHEIMLSYDFIFGVDGVVSPRLF